MAKNTVQTQLGDAMIHAIKAFARKDIESVEYLKIGIFSHIDNLNLKNEVAERMYGARWIYKMGLVVLAENQELQAHIRAQVMEYGSVCEGLLKDAISHGFSRNVLRGNQKNFFDKKQTKKIRWGGDKESGVTEKNLNWLLLVATEEAIIDPQLSKNLNRLRYARNKVHPLNPGPIPYLGSCKLFFESIKATCEATKLWKNANP